MQSLFILSYIISPPCYENRYYITYVYTVLGVEIINIYFIYVTLRGRNISWPGRGRADSPFCQQL